jgi:hypothetical protein
MTQARKDGKAYFDAWMAFVGGIFFTGDTLNGVGQASGFTLAMEWAKVVVGPALLATGGYELFRLYVRPASTTHESPDEDA